MQPIGSRTKGYVSSALLGAVVGGLAVTIATDAIPKTVSRMMCAMMNNMMAQAGDESLSPEEM